jgi:hypothetical protein
MNKLVLVLFFIVLLVVLAVGGFYLYQTQNIPFLSPPLADKIVQSLSNDCKDTGFSTQAEAAPYLDSLFAKAGYTNEKGVKNNLMTSVIQISGNCWSVWISGPNQSKTGILYWEGNKGDLKQKRATIEL